MPFVDSESAAYIIYYVRKESGVVLTPDKAYLIETRLKPVAEKQGVQNLRELVRVMRENSGQSVRDQVLDAMTTHETSFFRDASVFVSLREILSFRFLRDKEQKKLSIWSAACSTGQEPFSIAILLKEVFGRDPGWDLRISATDIASDVVERAKTGFYTRADVNRGLPLPFLTRYFDQMGNTWTVKPQLRSMVGFQRQNLLYDSPTGAPFDLILCRNVLIYYEEKTAQEVLQRIENLLAPKGVLVLGATENLIGRTKAFKPLGKGVPGVYEKA